MILLFYLKLWVFTWFSAMTLIFFRSCIRVSLHLCRWKLRALSSSPQAVIQLALNQATEEVKDTFQPATADANKKKSSFQC